jgi:hypothetical protein
MFCMQQRCGFAFILGGSGSSILKEFWIGTNPDSVAQKETFLQKLCKIVCDYHIIF